MLGQPALVAGHRRGDAQREALLAEKRVAAVAGADAPDRALLGEVHDEAAVGREVAERVQPRHEVLAGAELLEGSAAHARHDAHVRDHVRAVGDLDPDLAERRSERAHHVRDDVHACGPSSRRRTAATRAGAPRRGTSSCSSGRPSSRRPAGDEGEVLGAGDVGGMASVEVGAGHAARVERLEGSVCQHAGDEPLVLRVAEPSHQTTRSGRSVAETCSTQRSTGFIGTPMSGRKASEESTRPILAGGGSAPRPRVPCGPLRLGLVERRVYSSSGVKGSETTAASRRASWSAPGRASGSFASAVRTSASSAGVTSG